MVPQSWKNGTRAKIEKKKQKKQKTKTNKKQTLNDISLACGLISKWFQRYVPLIPIVFNLRPFEKFSIGIF